VIEFKQGDILKADAEALVYTVNCVGVMGRAVALQLRAVKLRTQQRLSRRCFPGNDRKRQFTERQILLARDMLARKGWITNSDSPS